MRVFDEAVIVSLPILLKAHEDLSGRRLVECEASNDRMDAEGDIIAQKALLESADTFLKEGWCDLNHYAELHGRLGLPGLPTDYILGYPREVKDLGAGRTGVVSEIRRSKDGSFNPVKNRYDFSGSFFSQSLPFSGVPAFSVFLIQMAQSIAVKDTACLVQNVSK